MDQKKRDFKLVLGAAMYQCALIGIMVNCAGVILAGVRTDLGFALSRVSNYSTLRSLCSALCGLVYIPLFFKWKKPAFLTLTVALVALGNALIILAPETPLWFVAAVLVSPASSVGVVAMAHIMHQHFPGRSGTVTGIVMAFSGIGGAVFSPVTAMLIEALGWRWAVVTVTGFAAVLALSGLALLFGAEQPEEHYVPKAAPRKRLEKGGLSGNWKRFLLCCVCLAPASVCTQLVPYVTMYAEDIGYALTQSATLTSMIMVGNICSKLLFGILYDKAGIWWTVLVTLMAQLLGNAGLLLFPGSMVSLCFWSLLYGCAYSTASIGVSKCATAVYGDRQGGRFSGVHTSVNNVTAACGLALVGVFHDLSGSFTPMFIMSITLTLASLTALFILSGGRKGFGKRSKYRK